MKEMKLKFSKMKEDGIFDTKEGFIINGGESIT